MTIPAQSRRPRGCTSWLSDKIVGGGLATLLLLCLSLAQAADPSVSIREKILIITDLNGQSEVDYATAALPAGLQEKASVVSGDSGGYELRLSGILYRADALLLLQWLTQDAGLRGRLEVGEHVEEIEEYVDPLDYISPVFTLNVQNSSDLEFQTAAGVPGYEELRVLDTPESQAEYVAALRNAAQLTSPESPLMGYIETNLGITALLEGKFVEAKQRFRRVANGEVAAAANHRLMSMWRLGWIAHQEGDHLLAYQIYREVDRFSTNARTDARCVKEIAGLIMELAKDKGEGTLDELRFFVREHRSRIGTQYRDDLATIDLMYAESYYYDDLLHEFLPVINSFLANAPDDARKQIATGLVFRGIALHRMGDFSSAIDSLDRVLQMDLRQEDRWQSIPDIKLHALRWIIRLCEREENQPLLDYYRPLYEARLMANR